MTDARILVVEGNNAVIREKAEKGGYLPTGQQYAETLRDLMPSAGLPDLAIDIVYPTDGPVSLPAGGLHAYAGVALTGSALNIYDDAAEVTRQIDLARDIFSSARPFFGSCWGLQVAAVAAGGRVGLAPAGREVGVARKIALTEAGRQHPMFAGKAAVFDSPCVHMDEVSIAPPDCTVLAANGHSAVQAMEIRHAGGTFWGVQYHPEFDLTYLSHILRRYRRVFDKEGFFRDPDQADRFQATFEALAADPGRRDLAWTLGIDADVLDAARRLTELRNWLTSAVAPALTVATRQETAPAG